MDKAPDINARAIDTVKIARALALRPMVQITIPPDSRDTPGDEYPEGTKFVIILDSREDLAAFMYARVAAAELLAERKV